MNMQQVARGWFVYDLTNSATDLAWVTMSFMAPQILLSLPGGIVADRMSKRRVIWVTQLMNGIATLALALIILAGIAEFSDFIIFGLINGAILALSFPARHAMVPSVLPRHLVFAGIALSSSAMNSARVMAPVFAGFLIALIAGGNKQSSFGVGIVFVVIAILYLFAVVMTLTISTPGDTHDNYTEKHPIQEIRDGFSYVWRHPTVFGLTLISILPFLFGFPLNTLLPAFNEDVLLGGPDDLGLLLSAMGIGAILGTIMLATTSDMKYKGVWLVASTIAWGIGVVSFGQLSVLVWSALALAAVGWISSWNTAMNRALLQQTVRPEMFGRVMSIEMMSHGLMPLGVLPISMLADEIGVDHAISISGLLLIASVFAIYLASPTIRHLMKPSPVIEAEEQHER